MCSSQKHSDRHLRIQVYYFPGVPRPIDIREEIWRYVFAIARHNYSQEFCVLWASWNSKDCANWENHWNCEEVVAADNQRISSTLSWQPDYLDFPQDLAKYWHFSLVLHCLENLQMQNAINFAITCTCLCKTNTNKSKRNCGVTVRNFSRQPNKFESSLR